MTLDDLKQAMADAGLEFYRVTSAEIRVAERVRMHLMDSGVCVSLKAVPRVTLTVRGQRSDYPAGDGDLFDIVRRAVSSPAEHRGFREIGAVSRDVTDPVDETSVLDVWHELTFAKDVDGVDALIDDVRWALSIPKCVAP